MKQKKFTKSDFLTYLDAPKHTWAKKHDQIEVRPSPLAVLMMNQGYLVEKYAREYLNMHVNQMGSGKKLLWQTQYESGDYLARIDALVFDTEAQAYDLYEIKSGTVLKKEYAYDAAFQHFVVSQHIPIKNTFILHLNKEYVLDNNIDVSAMFIAEDVSEDIETLRAEFEMTLPDAFNAAFTESPADLAGCLKPETCPCPTLCHVDLPEKSIFIIPRLSKNKKKMLLDMEIQRIKDIPDGFELSEKQQLIVDVVNNGKPYIDKNSIGEQISQFQYPQYFLDYESCISAIPLFDGYHPQQQVVFQYSLHRIDAFGAKPTHTEFISIDGYDPVPGLLIQLSQEIGENGTIFVWNKAFEKTRHNEMAVMQPNYAEFLADVNERIYDLGDFVNKGWYVHPGFKGRWSIKNVLPVMVPELSYQSLEIHNGEMASSAWWEITQEGSGQADLEKKKDALLRYCETDTLAMVRIYQELAKLI